MARKPLVIGILGGIGSGKTTVAAMFRKLGAHVLEADRLAHEALNRPGIRRRLVRLWGRSILNRQGAPDRRKIARAVFRDPEALRRLEKIVHPVVTRLMKEETRRAEGLVVWDAALLGEKGFHKQCDVLVFVDAPGAARRRRVQTTRRWTAREWIRREKVQMPLNKKRRLADYIINNNHSRTATLKQVERIATGLLNPVMN